MKKTAVFKLTKSRCLPLMVFLVSSTLFTACLKDNNSDNNPYGGPAYISFVHASPNTGQLLVGINGERVDRQNFNFGDRLIYLSLFPGAHRIQVNNADNKRLVLENYNLERNEAYTVFVADRLDSIRFVAVRDFAVRDEPQNNHARLRFINLCPDSIAFDARIQQQDTLLASNRGFGERSDFNDIQADNSTVYNVQMMRHNQEEVLQSIDFKPLPGRYYTIMAIGLMETEVETQKLSLAILQHD